MLQKLHEAGFLIAVDDFGSGYSSVNTRKDILSQVIKLDKGFIDQSMEEKGMLIMEYMILMAYKLHLEVVAEGVETWEQSKRLRDMGCHVGQGYCFARLMPCDAFKALYLRELEDPSINRMSVPE